MEVKQMEAKRMKNVKRPISWCELPKDILESVVKCLDSPLSIMLFRATCTSWRRSCPLPPHTHVLSSDFPYVFNGSRYITTSRVYLIEPLGENHTSRCWLVTTDELNPGKLSIRYPLSKYPVLKLPGHFPNVLNLLDFRVREIASSYALKDELVPHMNYWENYGFNYFLPIKYLNENKLKVVMFISHYSENNCLVILGHLGQLVALSLKENKWSQIHDGESFKFDDIVNYKGRIYGVERRGKTFSIEYESFEMINITSQIAGGGGRRKRLVVCGGHLYLVTQDKSEEFVMLKVYKLNSEKGKWIPVTNLSGHVLFVGSDYSFSLPVGAYIGFQEVSIFAFRDSFKSYANEGDGDRRERLAKHPSMHHSVGMFQIGEPGNFGPIDSYEILWPPPHWLQ